MKNIFSPRRLGYVAGLCLLLHLPAGFAQDLPVPGTPRNAPAERVPLPGGYPPGVYPGERVPVPGQGVGVPVPGAALPGTYPAPGGTVSAPPSGVSATAYPPSATGVPADIAQGECDRDSLVPGVSNQTLGRVVGGILGGVLGSQVGEGQGSTLATIGGVLAGALAGGLLAESMSAPDYACASRALEYSGPGQAVTWQNPDAHSQYTLTPQEIYQGPQGRECRQYSISGSVQGQAAPPKQGTACRGQDGNWQAVDF